MNALEQVKPTLEKMIRGENRNEIDQQIIGNEANATEWPDIVLNFKGEPDFPPFESARSQLVAPAEDPLS